MRTLQDTQDKVQKVCLMNKKEKQFVEIVWKYYNEHGRHDLPWRKTHNPYRILVSEIMLQQTQVERVIPKYQAFLRRFPTVKSLAQSELKDVLILWQGLGYNRRAKFLWQAAQAVVEQCGGGFPKDFKKLQTLPGIGSYTAAAVMNFAFNIATPLIETNVRTVYIHHFYKNKEGVTDADIMRLVERTVDRERPREWFWALMDYGTCLKKTTGNHNVRSKHYTKQSKFKGSDREIRGRIIALLASESDWLTRVRIDKKLPMFESKRISAQLESLLAEKLIQYKKGKYGI